MKKRIIAVGLVLGAAGVAYAGISQLAGTQSQSRYEQLLQSINEQQPYAVLSKEEYTSGLVNSTAVTKVTIPEPDGETIEFNLLHEIKHGALHSTDDGLKFASVNMRTTLQNPQTLPAEVLSALTDEIPFEVQTDISYTGAMHNRVRFSGIGATETDLSTQWSGISAEAVTSQGTTIASGSLGSMSVDNQSEGTVMSMDGSDFDVNLTSHGDMIFTGTAALNYNGVKLQTPALVVPVAVERASLATDISLVDDALNSDTTFDLHGIESELPLETASLDVQYRGLLVEGIRQYNALISSLSSADESTLGDEALTRDLVSAMGGIFKPGSEMLYELKLMNEGGEVDAQIQFGIKDVEAPGMSADALDKIVTGRDLLNVLLARANFGADMEALKDTPILMMLGSVGDYITVTEESITSTASLDGVNLNINGEILPLDAMFGRMLDVPLADLL